MGSYATIDRIFLDRLHAAAGDEAAEDALLTLRWRPFHRPVIDAFGARHVWKFSGFETPVRNRLVRLYPHLSSRGRARMLDHALDCGDEALATALLSRRPDEDALPWASFFDRQLRTGLEDWPLLRPHDVATVDRHGCGALGGLVRLMNENESRHIERDAWVVLNRGVAETLLPRLLVAGAPIDEVSLVLPGKSPMTALDAALCEGLPDLVQGLLAAGARLSSLSLGFVADAWSANGHCWRASEAQGRPLPSTWGELTGPSLAIDDAWFGEPGKVARNARCWELAVAAGASPTVSSEGWLCPRDVMAVARPDWLALWAEHDLGRHLPVSLPSPSRPRL